jgi:hypothetical protein
LTALVENHWICFGKRNTVFLFHSYSMTYYMWRFFASHLKIVRVIGPTGSVVTTRLVLTTNRVAYELSPTPPSKTRSYTSPPTVAAIPAPTCITPCARQVRFFPYRIRNGTNEHARTGTYVLCFFSESTRVTACAFDEPTQDGQGRHRDSAPRQPWNNTPRRERRRCRVSARERVSPPRHNKK